MVYILGDHIFGKENELGSWDFSIERRPLPPVLDTKLGPGSAKFAFVSVFETCWILLGLVKKEEMLHLAKKI